MSDPELDPVVVAVGRSGAPAAVRAGAAEARRTRRPLRLVHVAPLGDTWLRVVGREALAEAVELGRAEVGDRTACTGDLLRGDLIVQLRALVPTPALVVLERTETREDAVVPSTTVLLAEALEVPTLVVPSGWSGSDHAVVSVGLDPAAADDTALVEAMVRARLTGSVLRVVVVGPCSRAEVRQRLDRLGADACDLALETYSGSPVASLTRAADDSDLVILGRHPASATEPVVGGVGQQAVDRLPCPVLLTPPGHVHGEARTAWVG